MAVVQEERNPDLQDDGMQKTQAIHYHWPSKKAAQNEPGFLRDHQRPRRACQEDRLLQAHGRTDAIIEMDIENDTDTSYHPEGSTTTYTCARS